MKCLILFAAVLGLALAGSLPEGRLSGGELVGADDFPFQVSVRVGGSHVCSGVIIDPNWVLTAASCVAGFADTFVSIFYGSTNRVPTAAEQSNVVAAALVVVHSGFNRKNQFNDLALIKTATTLDASIYKQLAPLPKAGEELDEDVAVWVSGWGITGVSSGELSAKLRKYRSVVLNSDLCSAGYSGIIDLNTNNSGCKVSAQMCVGDEDHGVKGLCAGDAGGPVWGVLAKYNKVYGIASFSVGCGTEKEHPSVFTIVGAYREWINSHIPKLAEA